MTESQRDAQQALRMVAQSRRRADEFRNYAEAGPPLIAWGLVWIAGNLTAQFAPASANLVWPVAIAGAVLFTVVKSRRRGDGRIIASIATMFGFAVLSLAMIGGDARIQNALVVLIVAASYIVIGIWWGMRLVWLGLAVAVAATLGWFVFPEWLYLWLGLGGGGALLVSGLWLRRA